MLKKLSSVFVGFCLAISFVVLSGSNSNAVNTKRLSGEDRYYTSAYIALNEFNNGTDYAIIASGETFPDALMSGTLAIPLNAPILLVQKNSVPKIIDETLSDLNVKTVYVIGGKNTISDKVFLQLKNKYNARRIAGKDRIETSKEVAKLKSELFGFSPKNGVTGQVITNLNHEALCSSVVMSPQNHFLTITNALDGSTDYAFGNRPRTSGYYDNGYLYHFDAMDKYLFSAQCANHVANRIINEYHYDIITLYLVSGEKLPDALCASIYTRDNKSLLMLTPKNTVDKNVLKALKDYKINDVILIGGFDTMSIKLDEYLDNYSIYK